MNRIFPENPITKQENTHTLKKSTHVFVALDFYDDRLHFFIRGMTKYTIDRARFDTICMAAQEMLSKYFPFINVQQLLQICFLLNRELRTTIHWYNFSYYIRILFYFELHFWFLNIFEAGTKKCSRIASIFAISNVKRRRIATTTTTMKTQPSTAQTITANKINAATDAADAIVIVVGAAFVWFV